MTKEDFLNKMENLDKPSVNADASRKQIKLMILDARKSAAWGPWLLVLPLAFFTCVIIKELLHWDLNMANRFIEWMAALDKSPSTKWITPVLFALLPALCAIVNLLAIVHVAYDKPARELLLSIKMKWLNIVLAIISVSILGIVLLYGITESAAERAIHRLEERQQSAH